MRRWAEVLAGPGLELPLWRTRARAHLVAGALGDGGERVAVLAEGVGEDASGDGRGQLLLERRQLGRAQAGQVLDGLVAALALHPTPAKAAAARARL